MRPDLRKGLSVILDKLVLPHSEKQLLGELTRSFKGVKTTTASNLNYQSNQVKTGLFWETKTTLNELLVDDELSFDEFHSIILSQNNIKNA